MNFEINLSSTFSIDSVSSSESELQWKPMKKFKVASQYSSYIQTANEMKENSNCSLGSSIIVISSYHGKLPANKQSSSESSPKTKDEKNFKETWIRVI